MFERNFYHSFPRRHVGDDRVGLVILKSLLTNGLLLTPESTRFQNFSDDLNPLDGKPAYYLRLYAHHTRLCFTELTPPETDNSERTLSKHGEFFGHFALEFDVNSIRQLGALPVTYIPISRHHLFAEGIGLEMLTHLTLLRNRLAQEELSFSDPDWQRMLPPELTGHDRLIWEAAHEDDLDGTEPTEEAKLLAKHRMLLRELRGLDQVLSLCYPTERTPNDTVMRYFQQREWRIAAPLLHASSCKPLTGAQKRELLRLDKQFFERSDEQVATESRIVDKCRYYHMADRQHVFAFVRRVIAPSRCFDAAVKLIHAAGFSTPVLGLDR